MKYCVFNVATGYIRAVFDTPERDAELNVGPQEELYVGSADPSRQRVVRRGADLELVDCASEDLGDGSTWCPEQGRRLSLKEQAKFADDLIKTQLRIIDTQTVEIDGEHINLVRSIEEYIAAEPASVAESDALARIRKVADQKVRLRSQISAEMDTIARSS